MQFCYFADKKGEEIVRKEIYNEDRESVEVANHPMEILYLKCEQPLSEFDMGRKVLTNEK